MAEPHEPKWIVLVFGAGDILWNILDRADLHQHFERGLIGATMSRTPEASHTCRDAGKRICARRTGKPHCRGRRILLVISMEYEDPIECAGKNWTELIFLAWHGKAHAQEIRR